MDSNEWITSDWFKEWERLAYLSQKEVTIGRWVRYYNDKNELCWEYIVVID